MSWFVFYVFVCVVLNVNKYLSPEAKNFDKKEKKEFVYVRNSNECVLNVCILRCHLISKNGIGRRM